MRPVARFALWLGFLSVCPTVLAAQTFVELGGGWGYLAQAPAGQTYGRSFNVQASIGRQITRDVVIRLDAFTNQFPETVTVASHFNSPGGGCECVRENRASNGVAGLTVSALASLDPRGILYVIGGAGLYDVYGGRPRLSTGASAGAGISVPVRGRLRVFAEGRGHFLFGANTQPPWVAPITVGLRY